MQKQKGKISTLVGVIIVIAVAVVLFGGVFAYQYFAKFQTPISNENSNVQNSTDETADWKTYTNDEYGFEIKYPNNIFFTTGSEPRESYWYVKFFYSNNPGQVPLIVRVENSSLGRMSVENSKDANPGKNIAGIETKILYYDASGKCQETFLNTEDWSYMFDNYCGQDNLFDLMISTFKFTK